ncbi:MAG: 50S ribosomal protein L35 [Alphaproteobacteria bacterium]
MPKMKTKGGVKKRFKILKSGKVKVGKPSRRHLLMKRSEKAKRQSLGMHVMAECDAKKIRKWAPYG